MHDTLSASIPEQGPARVVHGDFGPHNSLFSHAGDIDAVLDWELASLGDPLADFAYSLNAWTETRRRGRVRRRPGDGAAGVPHTCRTAARYAELTGADLSNLAYYRAFNAWKTACILHGVYARYQAGQKSTRASTSRRSGRVSSLPSTSAAHFRAWSSHDPVPAGSLRA